MRMRLPDMTTVYVRSRCSPQQESLPQTLGLWNACACMIITVKHQGPRHPSYTEATTPLSSSLGGNWSRGTMAVTLHSALLICAAPNDYYSSSVYLPFCEALNRLSLSFVCLFFKTLLYCVFCARAVLIPSCQLPLLSTLSTSL